MSLFRTGSGFHSWLYLGSVGMLAVVRRFERRDRDQLTALINLHVAAVIPGVVLSVNTVLSPAGT